MLMFSSLQWKNCLSALEGKKFTVSIHFAYGLSLLENGSHRVSYRNTAHVQYRCLNMGWNKILLFHKNYWNPMKNWLSEYHKIMVLTVPVALNFESL